MDAGEFGFNRCKNIFQKQLVFEGGEQVLFFKAYLLPIEALASAIICEAVFPLRFGKKEFSSIIFFWLTDSYYFPR